MGRQNSERHRQRVDEDLCLLHGGTACHRPLLLHQRQDFPLSRPVLEGCTGWQPLAPWAGGSVQVRHCVDSQIPAGFQSPRHHQPSLQNSCLGDSNVSTQNCPPNAREAQRCWYGLQMVPGPGCSQPRNTFCFQKEQNATEKPGVPLSLGFFTISTLP